MQLLDRIKSNRADMRFGIDDRNEIFVPTKQDEMIRKLSRHHLIFIRKYWQCALIVSRCPSRLISTGLNHLHFSYIYYIYLLIYLRYDSIFSIAIGCLIRISPYPKADHSSYSI